MGLFKACDDPLILAIRQTYDAIPLRMPRSDVAPLCVVASDRHRSDFLGPLQHLLTGDKALTAKLASARAPSSLRKKSRSVGIDVGLNLLGGFLAAWGVSSAEIETKFDGATRVSFRFSDVFRWFIAPTVLSEAVRGRRLRVENKLVANFLGENALGFYVIDATITSRDFILRVEETKSGGFKLAVPAIQDIVGQARAGLTVETADELELTFKGPVDMPFAFSCLQFVVDDQGDIAAITLHDNTLPTFGFDFAGEPSSSKRVLLTDDPGLLEFDNAVP